ncbi:MAG: hypothetical protein GY915_01230 [bacterium]|nr:hypothetical protein [bacterium]
MPYIFLGLAVFIGALILARTLSRVEAHFMASILKGVAAAILVGAGVLSILMGRWPVFFVVLASAAVFFLPRPKKKGLPAKKTMEIQEACEILGLDLNTLSSKSINEAYHRLMKKNHPDHGGSAYLARQLNEARELLLEHIEQQENH